MKLKNTSPEKIIKAVKESYSFQKVFELLNLSNGTNNRKLLKKFISENNIDISHFDKHHYHHTTKKYHDTHEQCLQCGKTFISKATHRGKPRTCSRKCANIYFAPKKIKTETKIKISNSLKKLPRKNKETHKCKICNAEYKKQTKTCSIKCNKIYQQSPEYRKLLSEITRTRIAKGLHKGWVSRSITSYPEKYFKYRLDELCITYNLNYPIPKKSLGVVCSSCYFLDFYFPEIKLDLEIDGSQHKWEERKKSDLKRDEILKTNGITVFRISWVNPINEKNKTILETQFQEFLELYNNLTTSMCSR